MDGRRQQMFQLQTSVQLGELGLHVRARARVRAWQPNNKYTLDHSVRFLPGAHATAIALAICYSTRLYNVQFAVVQLLKVTSSCFSIATLRFSCGSEV